MQNAVERHLRSDTAWSLLGFVLMAGAAAAISFGLLKLSTSLVLVAVIGLGAVALIVAQPHLGLLLFLALHYILPVLFQGHAEVEGMRLPLAVSSLTLFAWLIHLITRSERFTWTPHLGWMLLFAGAIILSVFRLADSKPLVEALLDAGRMAMLFVLVQQLPRTEKRFQGLLYAFLWFNIVLAAGTIWGWVSGQGVILDRGHLRAVIHAGNFGDPNHLGAHLAVSLPLALFFVLEPGSWVRRAWSAAAFAAVLIAVILCGSRGAILATGAGIGALILLRTRPAVAAPFLIAIAVMVLAGYLGSPDESVTADDSAMGRIEAWKAGLQMFQQNPATGIGYEQFTTHFRIEAHDTFVQALAEGGLLAAFAWVGLEYWALLTLIRVRRSAESPGLKGQAAALLSCLVTALVAGLFLSHAYSSIPLILVGFAAALGLVAGNPSGERRANLPHYLATAGITLGGIGLLMFIVRGLL